MSMIFHTHIEQFLMALEDKIGQFWVMLHFACDNVDGGLSLTSTIRKIILPLWRPWMTQLKNGINIQLYEKLWTRTLLWWWLCKKLRGWVQVETILCVCSHLYMCRDRTTDSGSTTHLKQRKQPDATGSMDHYWKVFRSVTWSQGSEWSWEPVMMVVIN